MNLKFIKRGGVTLVEVVLSLSIFMILFGLLLSAISLVRDKAYKFACGNNLRQLGIAFQNYHNQFGSFPPYQMETEETKKNRGQYFFNYYTWLHLVLPYIEQENLWMETVKAMNSPFPKTFDPPHVGVKTVVPTFICPQDSRLTRPITDDRGNTVAYGSFWGVGEGIYGPTAMRDSIGVSIREILDGTSNSLLIGERPPAGRLYSGSWYTCHFSDLNPPDPKYSGVGISVMPVVATGVTRCKPPIYYGPGRIDNPCDSDHFWSLHKGGAHFLFVDGSTRFIPYSAKEILPKLATIAGGETHDLP